MNDSSTSEYAFVLWLAAMAVAALTAQVTVGWLTRARRQASFLESAPSQLIAGAALGTGVSASAVMGMLAEGLPIPIGYGAVAAVVLWLGAVIGSLLLVLGLTYSARWWMVLPASMLMAALAVGCQVGWVWAAGFRPGVLWHWPAVAIGGGVMVAGCLVGLSAAGQQGSRRRYDAQRFIRRGAAVLLGLSVMAGQQIALSGADLGSQQGSVYRNQVPAMLIGVGCGVLVPLTFAILSLDLSVRNRRRQRALSTFMPDKRNKRRHRVRTL